MPRDRMPSGILARYGLQVRWETMNALQRRQALAYWYALAATMSAKAGVAVPARGVVPGSKYADFGIQRTVTTILRGTGLSPCLLKSTT